MVICDLVLGIVSRVKRWGKYWNAISNPWLSYCQLNDVRNNSDIYAGMTNTSWTLIKSMLASVFAFILQWSLFYLFCILNDSSICNSRITKQIPHEIMQQLACLSSKPQSYFLIIAAIKESHRESDPRTFSILPRTFFLPPLSTISDWQVSTT